MTIKIKSFYPVSISICKYINSHVYLPGERIEIPQNMTRGFNIDMICMKQQVVCRLLLMILVISNICFCCTKIQENTKPIYFNNKVQKSQHLPFLESEALLTRFSCKFDLFYQTQQALGKYINMFAMYVVFLRQCIRCTRCVKSRI